MASSRLCSIPNCSKPHFTQGFCCAHYRRLQRHGDPVGGKSARLYRQKICSVHGCGNRHSAGGFCSRHYHRFVRHGDPLGGGTSSGEPQRHFREVVLPYDGDECLVWPFSRNSQGYATMSNKLVSRLVCERTHGKPPSRLHEAAHSCGKGHESCVAKRHLSWKTHAENMGDKVEHGTYLRGEDQYNAKLTEDTVRQIRKLKGHYSESALAKIFGVSRGTISSAMRRKSWAWVE